MLMVMAIAIPGIVIYFAFELYSTTHDDGSDNTDESPGKVAPSSHAPRSSHDSSVEYKPSNYIDYNEREESEREVRCFW